MPRSRPPQHSGRKAPPADLPGAVSPWVQLRSATFHPFIFKRMIAQTDLDASPGDIVQVYDKQGELFGRGLFNPKSEIALRMLTHGDVAVDEAFWRQRLADAIELRRKLRIDAVTDACRLVHAEADRLSGIVIERFADTLVAEVFSLGMYNQAHMLLDLTAELLGPPSRLDRPQQVADTWRRVVRSDERSASLEGFSCRTPPPAKTVIREHDVRYHVDLSGGHKTGFFCDQRDNRRKFATLCHEADVLDCCSYTGGFGLCAKVHGGAREVTSVDLDEAALAIARENANLNQARIKHVHDDAFHYLRQMYKNGRTFDAIVLDPPKLALARADIDDALRKYEDLNTLGIQIVKPGGFLLTCSCSGLIQPHIFQDTVYKSARRAERRLQRIDSTGAAPDHPIADDCPETGYLKALWFRVL